MKQRLSYGNVVATVALFVALGGGSYAAVQLPSGSVGVKQLRNQAVSSAKIKDGAVVASKIADGAVSGVKVDASTLRIVPSANHAINADSATHADSASSALNAYSAIKAVDTSKLDGRAASAYGAALVGHTEIPATNVNAEWWVPVSGMGQPQSTLKGVEMLTPSTTPLFARGFTAFSWEAPGPEDDAEVHIQLYHDEEPVTSGLTITRLAYSSWGEHEVVKIEAGGRLAIRVGEVANGEEIPALSLQTSLLLSPSS